MCDSDLQALLSQTGGVFMAFCARARIGIEPPFAVDAKISGVRVDAGMTRDAVVFGVAAGAFHDVATSHHAVVIGRACIDKTWRVKRDP